MHKFTSKAQNQVREFHELFNHPVSELPKPMTAERALNRAIWTGEELIEFLHSANSTKEEFANSFALFLDGIIQAYKKSYKEDLPSNETERVIAQADALTDIAYFNYGSFVEIGVDAQPVFDIVQGANLSKLFTDGNGTKYARYREDGKILKSPEFYSPEPFIKEEVQNQINKSLTK